MRIYNGWVIKSLSNDTRDLDGAVIIGSIKIRKTYRYCAKLKNGQKVTLNRENVLNAVQNKTIEFRL